MMASANLDLVRSILAANERDNLAVAEPPYAVLVRSQLRTIVFSVVAVLIVLAVITEPLGGTVESVGLAVVFVTMIVLILRERRKVR